MEVWFGGEAAGEGEWEEELSRSSTINEEEEVDVKV
jgi:hypothetical protein